MIKKFCSNWDRWTHRSTRCAVVPMTLKWRTRPPMAQQLELSAQRKYALTALHPDGGGPCFSGAATPDRPTLPK